MYFLCLEGCTEANAAPSDSTFVKSCASAEVAHWVPMLVLTDSEANHKLALKFESIATVPQCGIILTKQYTSATTPYCLSVQGSCWSWVEHAYTLELFAPN